jgi:carnitine 3-dehydrogenase
MPSQDWSVSVKRIEMARNIAVVGAGTVGASWTAFFLSRGLHVSVYDPEALRQRYVDQYLRDSWSSLRRLVPDCPSSPDRWTFHSNLGDAVAGVDFIHESAPEDFTLKRQLYVALVHAAPSDVIIASSTSSLTMSDLQRDLATRERFLVAHPFNPPHLIPIVEVVGGRDTSAGAVDWCVEFLTLLGKSVIRLHKEVVGHVVNRLQAALFQEAVGLIRDGVVDIADIDRGIAFGPAIRWALMGPFLTFHLGAREGIRGYLRDLGPAHERMWRDLKHVHAFTPELIEGIGAGVDSETKGMSVEALTTERDILLTELLAYMAQDGSRLLR